MNVSYLQAGEKAKFEMKSTELVCNAVYQVRHDIVYWPVPTDVIMSVLGEIYWVAIKPDKKQNVKLVSVAQLFRLTNITYPECSDEIHSYTMEVENTAVCDDERLMDTESDIIQIISSMFHILDMASLAISYK